MMFSLPSFLAAAIRALMPPISAADLALAALVVEVEVVCPHAVSRTRAPATMLSRRSAPVIPAPPRAGRPGPESRVAEAKRIPFSPPFRVGLVSFPPFNHLPDGMSRSGRLSLATVHARGNFGSDEFALPPGTEGASCGIFASGAL